MTSRFCLKLPDPARWPSAEDHFSSSGFSYAVRRSFGSERVWAQAIQQNLQSIWCIWKIWMACSVEGASRCHTLYDFENFRLLLVLMALKWSTQPLKTHDCVESRGETDDQHLFVWPAWDKSDKSCIQRAINIYYHIPGSTAQGGSGNFKDRKPLGGWLLWMMDRRANEPMDRQAMGVSAVELRL